MSTILNFIWFRCFPFPKALLFILFFTDEKLLKILITFAGRQFIFLIFILILLGLFMVGIVVAEIPIFLLSHALCAPHILVKFFCLDIAGQYMQIHLAYVAIRNLNVCVE